MSPHAVAVCVWYCRENPSLIAVMTNFAAQLHKTGPTKISRVLKELGNGWSIASAAAYAEVSSEEARDAIEALARIYEQPVGFQLFHGYVASFIQKPSR